MSKAKKTTDDFMDVSFNMTKFLAENKQSQEEVTEEKLMNQFKAGTLMGKYYELLELCAGSVTLMHNEHRDYYQTVEGYLNEQERNLGASLEIDPDVRKFMIERNHMCTLRAYPNTPIVFYIVYHWDFEAAVDQMLEAIKKGNKSD